MISTRGRYALRVMADLAGQEPGAWVPLRSVAQRQEISLKYLEGIMAVLSRAELVESAPGRGRGYRLRLPPEEYRVAQILRLTEGTLAPVSCLAAQQPCSRAAQCKTLPLWTRLDRMIDDFLNGITLADLLHDPGMQARDSL